jgi:hypothetical protein
MNRIDDVEAMIIACQIDQHRKIAVVLKVVEHGRGFKNCGKWKNLKEEFVSFFIVANIVSSF